MLNFEPIGKRDFNLLPKRLKASRMLWKAVRKAFVGLFGIVGICVIASFVMLWQIYIVNNEKANVDNQIVALRPVLAIQGELNNQQANFNKIERYYKSIENQSTSIYGFLRHFEKILPVDISFVSITYTEVGKIDINGLAKNEIAVNDLTNNLRTTDRFSDVFISKLSKKDTAGSITFALNCKFDNSQLQDSKGLKWQAPKASPAPKASATPNGSPDPKATPAPKVSPAPKATPKPTDKGGKTQ